MTIVASAMCVWRTMAKEEVYVFSDPLEGPTEDVVAVGGNLSVGTLVNAYARGIFPWPHEGYPMLWFFPQKRGVIFAKDFHAPRSLKKLMRHKNYLFKWNQHFPDVITACQAQPRPNQPGTWITDEMRDAYVKFHRAGYAKCLSVHDSVADRLLGGIYGVHCRGSFSAESMFFYESNASKVALNVLCEFLFFAGLSFVDVQMVTETSEKFGATYVSAQEYQKLLVGVGEANQNLEKLWEKYEAAQSN